MEPPTIKELPAETPDYEMDELDRINPFEWQEGFQPEMPTPPPSPVEDKEEEAFPPPPPPIFEKSERPQWAPPLPTKFLENYSESNDLRTLSSMITKMGKSNQEKVKSGNYKGWSIGELIDRRDAINSAREGMPRGQVSASELQWGKERLKTTPPSPPKEKPMTSFEEAIVSRWPAFEIDDNDDEEWMEGSGFSKTEEKLIDNLYVMLGHLRAGGNSIKTKYDVKNVLEKLVKHGALTKNNKNRLSAII